MTLLHAALGMLVSLSAHAFTFEYRIVDPANHHTSGTVPRGQDTVLKMPKSKWLCLVRPLEKGAQIACAAPTGGSATTVMACANGVSGAMMIKEPKSGGGNQVHQIYLDCKH